MDPRRIPELSEAAARGAARKAAADSRQRSIQEAMSTSREQNFSPDVEMMDAPGLSTNRPSGLNRVMSLMRSGSLSGAASLDRQRSMDSAATLESDSNSEPYSMPQPTSHLTISTRPTGSLAQRRSSGGLASTSYEQPLASNRLQHSSSLNQPLSSQVIELDDDSPLPMRQRGQANLAGNSRMQFNAPDRQNSSTLVDLTGESPPVARLPSRRPTNRVNLESIGSHLLRSSSSDLGARHRALPLTANQQPSQRTSSRYPSSTSRYSNGNLYGQPPDWPSSTAAHASGPCNDNFSCEAGDFLDLNRLYPSQLGSGNERPDLQRSRRGHPADISSRSDPSQQHRSGGAEANQGPAQLYSSVPFGGRPDSTSQEDMDLALAMSLAAEDEEAASRVMAPPCYSTRFPSTRHRQQGASAGARFFQHQPAHASSDPMAAIAHSLLGGSRFDDESGHALLATLMADFEASRAVHGLGQGSGSGHQDMSYEALTNLEDVKLTAPPELLATMPLDMCLKGGPWDDKACSICQSEYEPDEVIMILPCEHHFHQDCAMEWLGKHSKKCPICKESIGG